MAPHSHQCLHCAQGLGAYRVGDFCCSGCQVAFHLLRERGLDRYYELRGTGRGLAIGAAAQGGSAETHQVLGAAMEAALDLAASHADEDGDVRLDLDIEGLHCAGCVWTIQTLFDRCDGAAAIDVNPGQGQLSLVYGSEAFPIRDFLQDLSTLGYRTGPAGTRNESADDATTRGLLIRCGVAIAIAINSMVLALAGYFGLPATDPLHDIFGAVNAVLGTLAVLVGAPLFAVPAWQALKRRVLHLDLPIAVGMIAAWAGSMALFFMVGPEAAYFDSLTVFVALMLVGRFVQHRMVARNRSRLRQDHGVAAMHTRRLDPNGAVHHIPLTDVRPGDELLIAPGELVPTLARALDARASLSLAWITGESEAVELEHGASVAAGAHNVGDKALRVEALESFQSSRLDRLLRRSSTDDDATMVASPFWGRVSAVYVIAVLSLAVIGFAAWWSVSPGDAIEVAVAVLVVTCPCAIGLATPLAEEMALANLRRTGLFARRGRFLDRLHEVTQVVFDKTGTLTTDALEVVNPGAIVALSPFLRRRLFQLVGRSNHPRSRAITEALIAIDPSLVLDRTIEVSEVAGVGLSDGQFRVAQSTLDASNVSFLEGDEVVLDVAFDEPLKRDAKSQVAELDALGLELWILSGDDQARVNAAANQVGVSTERAVGDLAPEEKAARIKVLGSENVLMMGDGINDALAFEAAGLAGTPAVDRPQLPARADFYLLSQGVGPISEAIQWSRRLRRVVRRNIGFAIVYNTLGVGAALAGVLSPLACAVFMPASSIAVLALTATAMRTRRDPSGVSHSARALQPVGAVA